MSAWLKSLHYIYLAAWRSLSSSSWPLTAMWPPASPCGTQPSGVGRSASFWLFLHGLGLLHILWLRLSWPWSCLSVDPIWLIIIFVICSPYWNLHAWTCVWSTCCWCRIVAGPLLKQFCDSDDLIHCHLTFSAKPQCRREGKSSLHLHFPHHCSHLIPWSVYIHLHMSPNHFPHGQDGVHILYYWDTLSQPPDLHTEECRSEKCHEKAMAYQNYLYLSKRWTVGLGWVLTESWFDWISTDQYHSVYPDSHMHSNTMHLILLFSVFLFSN